MKYEVGQIIFMCSSKSIQVVPLKVVEEIIKTNLDGVKTTYTVQFPDNNKTRVSIEKLKGEVFSSSDEVKAFMIKNSTEAIEKMVTAAEILNKEVFGAPVEKKIINQPDENESDLALVDIGNGQKAKIDLGELKKINTK